MAAFNAAPTIAASIRSVIAQSRSDWELLIADDGSTDETVTVINSFHDPRIHLLPGPHEGPAQARNRALARARGRLVCFLDSDDLYLPSYLAGMGAALEAAPDASLAYTEAWILHDPPGKIDKRTTSQAFQPGPDLPPSDPSELFATLLADNFVFVATTCRCSAIEQVGPFNPKLVGVEDYELWLRLAARGHTFVRVPEPLVIYRRHPGALSANATAQAKRSRDLYATVLKTYELDDEARVTVEQRVATAEQHVLLLPGGAGLTSIRHRGRAAAGQLARRVIGLNLYRHPPNREVQETLALGSAPNTGPAAGG